MYEGELSRREQDEDERVSEIERETGKRPSEWMKERDAIERRHARPRSTDRLRWFDAHASGCDASVNPWFDRSRTRRDT